MSDEKTNSYAFTAAKLAPPNYNITFHDGKKEVGRLDFNGPKPVFVGDMDESAEIFLRLICESFAGRLAKEREPLERENAALRDAIKDALPWMIKLGDYIGNGTQADPMGRCNAITKMRIAVEKRDD